jgi:vacuolar-type H+-ATPase subunit I/STV1
MLTTRTLRRERVYTVKNTSRRPREVLIEYPITSDWELVLPPKVEEKTRSLYRLLVSLPPGGTAGSVKDLSVVEERKVSQSVALTNLSDDTIAFYLRSREVSPRIKAALEEISTRKGRLIEAQRTRQEEERKLQQIRQEQARIRQNMDALSRDSSLYKRYVQQLSDQEDELEKILERIDDLRARELEQQQELERYILSLQIE